MKQFFIILLSLLFVVPVMSQDTLSVRTFDDLGPALEKKLEPLKQLESLPHDDCNCEECMVIKNKVADEVDAIVLDVDIQLEPWQSRTFHEKIKYGMNKIETLNKLGEKIRNKERLRHRHHDHECEKCPKTLEN